MNISSAENFIYSEFFEKTLVLEDIACGLHFYNKSLHHHLFFSLHPRMKRASVPESTSVKMDW